MCGHGSDLIVVWVHIGMKAILSLCGMHMGLTTIVSLCRCVWAETAIASLYWCVQEERSYRCAGMCIGIDRIDIGVYSHYTWAEAVRDSERGVSESTKAVYICIDEHGTEQEKPSWKEADKDSGKMARPKWDRCASCVCACAHVQR